MDNPKLSNVQRIALSLIQSDAKFLNTMLKINNLCKYQECVNNYMSMLLPYIGIFSHGAEMWGKKIGLKFNVFNEEETRFYEELRNSHKIFKMKYEELIIKLESEYKKSDEYFYKTRTFYSQLTGRYHNIGIDVFNGKYCGNTILISCYFPNYSFNLNKNKIIKTFSAAGKLMKIYLDNDKIYKFNPNLKLNYLDINLNNKNEVNVNNIKELCYFSILCSINYVIEFLENIITEETSQKLKISYILYYYLCDLLKEINKKEKTDFKIDDSLKDYRFRNCIAHYGLGQVMNESDIIEGDFLGGLTKKIFNMDYFEVKNIIYNELKKTRNQIEIYLKKNKVEVVNNDKY